MQFDKNALDATTESAAQGRADKLIYMANQIARFMHSRPHDQALRGLAEHINDFWEPRMRRQLFEQLEAGGAGLDPLVIEAGDLIRRPASAP
jgi:formate dehydrogenase subunit delta